MAVHVPISKDLGTATATASAIAEGRFLKRDAAGKLVQQAAAEGDLCCGVAAADAAASASVRVYLPGAFCKIQAGESLNANAAEDYKLTADANGKAVKSANTKQIMAIWYPRPGETAADGDMITCKLLDPRVDDNA